MFNIKKFLEWCYEYKNACDEEAKYSYENECYSIALNDVINKVKRMIED